jgi:hypothetical protein
VESIRQFSRLVKGESNQKEEDDEKERFQFAEVGKSITA